MCVTGCVAGCPPTLLRIEVPSEQGWIGMEQHHLQEDRGHQANGSFI